MLRFILIAIALLTFADGQETNAVRERFGQTSARIWSTNSNASNAYFKEYARQQYRISRARDRSPTFSQSRHFHAEQWSRDHRDLGHLLPYQPQLPAVNQYVQGGVGPSIVASSQEGCRLTNNHCAHDSQCCSGKCRYVRWSVMGKMSCYKKCF